MSIETHTTSFICPAEPSNPCISLGEICRRWRLFFVANLELQRLWDIHPVSIKAFAKVWSLIKADTRKGVPSILGLNFFQALSIITLPPWRFPPRLWREATRFPS